MKKINVVEIYFKNLDIIEVPEQYIIDSNIYGIKRNLSLKTGVEEETFEQLSMTIQKNWTETNFINYDKNNIKYLQDLNLDTNIKYKKMSILNRLIQYQDIVGINLKYNNNTERYFFVSDKLENNINKKQKYRCVGNGLIIDIGR